MSESTFLQCLSTALLFAACVVNLQSLWYKGLPEWGVRLCAVLLAAVGIGAELFAAILADPQNNLSGVALAVTVLVLWSARVASDVAFLLDPPQPKSKVAIEAAARAIEVVGVAVVAVY